MSKKEETRLTPAGKAAAVALNELQKTIRFFRLYPQEHPFCARALEDTEARLEGYFGQHGPLELEIQREGVALDGQVVLAGSEQSTDLAALLYPEGIRELELTPGLPRDELRQFAAILSAHYPEGTGGDTEAQAGNDLLTALWKPEFTHIAYHAHDQLSLREARPGNDPDLGELARRADRLYQGYRGRATPFAGQPDVSAFLSGAGRGAAPHPPPSLAADPERVGAFLETPLGAERKRLLEELHDPNLGDLLGRASDIVMWSTVQADLSPARTDVVRFLTGSTLGALGRGDLEQAIEVLERVAAADEEQRVLVPGLLEQLATTPALKAVARALEGKRSTLDADHVVDEGLRYLARLEDAAIGGACELYPELVDESVRRVFRRYLSARVERGTPTVVALTTHKDERVVRDAVGMLAVAADGSEARKLLQEWARSQEVSLRVAVAKEVLETVTGERSRRALLEVARSDPDKRRRMLAVKRIKEEANPAAFGELSELVSAAEFAQRDDDEMHLCLDALTALGGVRAIRVLSDLAARKAFLFGRRDVQRVRAAAEAWLRQMRNRRRGGTGRE